jgi:hypothetical protein
VSCFKRLDSHYQRFGFLKAIDSGDCYFRNITQELSWLTGILRHIEPTPLEKFKPKAPTLLEPKSPSVASWKPTEEKAQSALSTYVMEPENSKFS